MSRWFRFYGKAMRSPRVLALSDREFRGWVNLLCIASERGGRIPPDDVLKKMLGMRYDHLKSLLSALLDSGLVVSLEDGYAPKDWNEYQYKSDTSTERVRKHREKRNVSETPPDTDTDTDTDSSENSHSPHSEGKKKYHRLPDGWEPTRDLPETVQAKVSEWPDGVYESALDDFRNWAANAADQNGKGKKLDWDRAWWNWIGRKHDDRQRFNGHGQGSRTTRAIQGLGELSDDRPF